MSGSTLEKKASGRSIHRTIGRLLRRTFRRPGRTLVPLVLVPVLAIGTVSVTSPSAWATFPEVFTALPSGVRVPGTAVAFGSAIVWDSVRSTDAGATFTADPALEEVTGWDFVGGGTMARTDFGSGTTTTAYVYTPSTGAEQSYTVPTGISAINATYVMNYASSYNMLTSASSPLLPPSGATGEAIALNSTNAVLWNGSTSMYSYDLFAVSTNPLTPAGQWVSIPDVVSYQFTDTDFLYLQVTTSAVTVCRRPIATFTAAPNCLVVATGDHTTNLWPSLTAMGGFSVVDLQEGNGPLPIDHAWVLSSTMTTATPVQIPTDAYLATEFQGTSSYVVLVDAQSVPVVESLASNGSLTPSFAMPVSRSTVSPYYLAATPDRAVGADPRDGAAAPQVWSRTVSAGGLNPETWLPTRASGLVASDARTVVWGRGGVVAYDGTTVQHTFADQASINAVRLSGPYVVELLADAADNRSAKVSKTDGTLVAQLTGWPTALFGSQYISTSADALPSGSLHVTVRDLTGVAAVATYTLPAGTANCGAMDVWGTSIALYCPYAPWENTTRVYNYKTGALLGSTSGLAESIGDGYAVVDVGGAYAVWAIASNSLYGTNCRSTTEGTDGVGHVVCETGTQLLRGDYSSLSTQAPRVLGVLAAPTASFGEPGSTWSLAIDTTKALAAGSVVISNGSGTPVRTVPVPASADGSVRVTWDGLDGAGTPVPAGRYTYKLVANAADGTGAVATIDGTAMTTTGTVTITGASTLGMAAGGFATLSPYRLLDTRVTPPKLAAGATRSLKVTGVGGVPSSGVSAVVLNVTVTETSNGGYLTVSPTGSSRPVVSNLNWSAGATIPNAVTVKVGTNGMVDLYQSGPGTAQVIVDVAGYYIDGTVAAAGGFSSVAPARILDTRTTGGKIAANTSRDLQVTGAGGIPGTGVSAVVLNVTVTETTAGGYLTVYPAGTPKPLASNLNWGGGATIPNLVTVKLGDTGMVSLYQSGPGTAQVIVDVAGYYLGGTATQPGTFVALSPARVLDTRSSSPAPANGDVTLTILGKGGIPATGVSSVVINTTVTDTRAPGFLTVFPGTSTLPTASNLNWGGPGQTIPNLVTTQVGSDGTITFHNGSGGTTHVIADTAGYYNSY